MSPAPIIPRRKSRKRMRKGKPAPIRQEVIPSIPKTAVRQTNPAESPKRISAFGIFPVLRSKKSAAPEIRRSSAHFTVRYVNCITSEEYRKPATRTYAHSKNFRRESAAEQGILKKDSPSGFFVPGLPPSAYGTCLIHMTAVRSETLRRSCHAGRSAQHIPLESSAIRRRFHSLSCIQYIFMTTRSVR